MTYSWICNEPSTLEVDIMDGSAIRGRTFHELGAYHGWFMSQKRTFHAVCPNRGRFEVKGVNLPRRRAESWTVRGQNGEPSTPVVDIMDGSYLKHEPPHEAPLSRRSLRWRHQPPHGGMRRAGQRRWYARYVFIVMERGRRNDTSFLRTRPSQTAFGPLPLVPRAASPAK